MSSSINSGSIFFLVCSMFLCPAPAVAELHNAKGMFFDQLGARNESINVGLKYWIQLRRNGKVRLVDNRTEFVSGDEIKFQIVPNIAGYAHVVLEKGTTGQRKLLFPNTYEPRGRVLPGKQYLLPCTGYLRFDENPGIETVRVVISRSPLTESALLHDSNNKMTIAHSSSGTEPLRNKNHLVAFSQAETKNLDLKSDGGKDLPEYSKDLVYIPWKTGGMRGKVQVHRTKHRATVATSSRVVVEPALRPGSVTVINIAPEENLVAEIQLTHR